MEQLSTVCPDTAGQSPGDYHEEVRNALRDLKALYLPEYIRLPDWLTQTEMFYEAGQYQKAWAVVDQVESVFSADDRHEVGVTLGLWCALKHLSAPYDKVVGPDLTPSVA